MKSQSVRFVALILLVIGAAALIYGIVSFSDFRNSVAGRVTGAARGVANQIVGRGNVGLADVEKRAIAFMAGGGLGVLVGGVMLFSGRRR